jgi:fatty acid desaturase
VKPASQLGKTLNSPRLHERISPLRATDNVTNWFYIAADYAALALILCGSVGFFENRAAWGLSFWWNVPVAMLAVLGVGMVQHRFAGLVHEGAHYILFKNRLLNEWASDLLCMFPLVSTTAQYRVMHLGHHDHVNDWDRDPELVNMGETRMMNCFPMSVRRFLHNFYVRSLWPPRLFEYLWDNFYCITLGNARHPYEDRAVGPKPPMLGKFRVTSLLGLAYMGGMIAILSVLAYRVSTTTLLLSGLACWLVGSAVCLALPEQWYFRQCLRPVVSTKATSVVRLGFLTCLELWVGWSRANLGPQWGMYFYLLWVLPLFTSWPYIMLLRDIYQHANADDGKLTNSRVFLVNPVLRWGMFIYGQDIHLTHHLYPTIPHYRLRRLHDVLREENAEYAEHVVEAHGVFWNRTGAPTALECLLPAAAPATAAKLDEPKRRVG